jgi:hypothetical protein
MIKITDILDQDIDVDLVERIVEEYVEGMDMESVLNYVTSNMKDFYINVADVDETNEFVKTHIDTSIAIEELKVNLKQKEGNI